MTKYISKTIRITIYLNALIFCITCISCKKFLDEKPDKSLVIPRNVSELQGVLDQGLMSINYPIAGEMANDNVYYNYTDWLSMPYIADTKTYVWDPNTDLTTDWTNAYNRILNTNIVLSYIDKIADNTATSEQRNNVRGSALFYRAFNIYELAQIFTPQYNSVNAQAGLGIPLKVNSNAEDITVRSTVQQTYDFIVTSLKTAIPLLPPTQVVVAYKTRPSRAAAYALLARTYLVMGNYTDAGKYADSSLQLFNTLLDYNDAGTVNSASNTPIQKFNKEVIFHVTSNQFNSTTNRVDTALYNSYDDNDIRKKAFWRSTAEGWWRFKGNYNGSSYGTPFCGIAVDEVYLIRAECYARNNKIPEAMNDLNTLLVKRWKTGLFDPDTALSSADALNKVLYERRKELCYRPSLRWSDLRRLNQDNNYARILKRSLNGVVYALPADDLRYAFLIPLNVIAISGIEQNPR